MHVKAAVIEAQRWFLREETQTIPNFQLLEGIVQWIRRAPGERTSLGNGNLCRVAVGVQERTEATEAAESELGNLDVVHAVAQSVAADEVRTVVTGLIVALQRSLRRQPGRTKAQQVHSKQASGIASNGNGRLLASGERLRQAGDLRSSVNYVVAEGEVAKTDAVSEVARGAVDRGSVNVGQIAVAVRLEDRAAVAGDDIELIMVEGIKGAPVVRDIPVGTAGGFGFSKGIGESVSETGERSGGAVNTVPCCNVCSYLRTRTVCS